MSLVVGVVSHDTAFLMSDGLVTSVDEAGKIKVWETDFPKIYLLPSGDRLMAVGAMEECHRLATALQRSEAVPVTVTAARIEAWGNRKGQCKRRNYFAVVGRLNGEMYVWRGIASPEGWGENIAVQHVRESQIALLCDGFLGPIREEIESDSYFGPLCAGVSDFGAAVQRAHEVFLKIYQGGGDGRIGGQIFVDSFTTVPTISAELYEMMSSAAAPATSETPKMAATHSFGNLKLKNIAQGVATTAGPTTTSNTPSVIAEMSQTITTKGNKILAVFNGSFQVSVLAGLLSIYLYRDSVSIGYVNLTSAPGASYFFPSSLSWIDNPSAGSHTYDIRWTISSGTATAVGTDRALQIVELG